MSLHTIVQTLSKYYKFDFKEAWKFINGYKGAGCSKSGNQYERDIFNVLKSTTIHGKPFCTGTVDSLAGSTAGNDIECNFLGEKDIGIEVKKCRTPDWMQCSIKFKDGKWGGSQRCKIPKASREIFNELLNNVVLFGGNTPPFFERKVTHEEWLLIKKEKKWKDHYIPIPNYIIRDLYRKKGCQYIQISDYGLYHLGEDVCGFGVPEFIIEQQLRIRTKIHKRKNAKGFCNLSVTAACQPCDIRTLNKSPYSLDDVERLPYLLRKGKVKKE